MGWIVDPSNRVKMYSSSESTGGGSNFPRSSGLCHEMKTSDFVSGTASASGKAIPDVHSNNCLSQCITVPVQTTQDNVEAPQAKQGSDYEAQAPTYFPSKQDNREKFAKRSASSQKEAKKNINRAKNQTHSKQQTKGDKNKSSKYVHQSLFNQDLPPRHY